MTTLPIQIRTRTDEQGREVGEFTLEDGPEDKCDWIGPFFTPEALDQAIEAAIAELYANFLKTNL